MPLDGTPREIVLPANGWRPRPYQRPLWRYLERGGTRACAIHHRRAGKDEIALHWTCIAAHMRVANYWHLLPQQNQARKAIWMATNPDTGQRRINEAFPLALRRRTLDNEMMIEFKNGSTWQVVGSDNYDALVGSSPYGVVFSEWAISHPSAWGFIEPILLANGGWAMFITTSRGKNHAYRTYNSFLKTDGAFAELLGADQTSVFTSEQLEGVRQSLKDQHGDDMGEALYQQEYHCSWDAAILGSYWGAELAASEREGRIRAIPIDPKLPVHDAWDIGRRDSTAIWMFQTDGRRIRIVDYYENSGKDASHYVHELLSRGYRRGVSWLPHDARVTEWTANRTRLQTLIDAGLNARLVPDHKLMDGINSARQTIPLVEFNNSPSVLKGIEALKAYQKEWNEKMQRFGDLPLHNWASHAADSWRYLCVAWREDILPKAKPEPPTLGVGRTNRQTLRDFEGRGARIKD